MAVDARDVDTGLDANLLAALPDGARIASVTPAGLSEWCNTYRIEVMLADGNSQAFFQKECKGQYGYDMMQASFQAESILHEFIPEFSPKPIVVGTYESDQNMHFFLSDFIEMIEDDIPSPESYMAAVVALHDRSFGKSPDGRFGFPIPTRFGDLEQTNLWTNSWETFWTNQMREILDREERIRGQHSDELARLRQAYFDKVLPRYLRPLESDGRSVTPCLVHADLWPGNCRYKLDMETVCMYDASAFWGHNEVDLGVFRNPRYPLGRPYLREYWKNIPISAPEEDADSRNSMYMIRNQILLATLYPTQPNLREVPTGVMPPRDTIGDSSTTGIGKDVERVDNVPASQPDPTPYTVFKPSQKLVISLITAFAAMFSTMSSFVYLPALVPIAADLNVSLFLINLTVTSYLVVAGVAPAFMGDMADQNGRRPVYILMFSLMIAANIGMALQTSFPALLVLRMVQSAGSSGLYGAAYGEIADISKIEERGSYVGILLLMTDIAPSLGPVFGGVLVQQAGWRWIFWFLVILTSSHFVVILLFLPETQRRIVGNGSWKTKGVYRSFLPFLRPDSATVHVESAKPKRVCHVPNPFTCLPILLDKASLLTILITAVNYAVKMTLQTSLGTLGVETYNLTYLQSGLTYLPSGIGGGVGSFIAGKFLDRTYEKTRAHLKADKGEQLDKLSLDFPLESARLRGVYILSIMGSLGAVGYGLGLMTRTHISVMLIMQFLTGATTASTFVLCGTLLTDLNIHRSATAQAASNLVRCLSAAGAIAAMEALVQSLGPGWCFAIYAILLM
ncbi:Major facilitator superfamily transporter, partial [Apiospora saccharicola]